MGALTTLLLPLGYQTKDGLVTSDVSLGRAAPEEKGTANELCVCVALLEQPIIEWLFYGFTYVVEVIDVPRASMGYAHLERWNGQERT